VKKRIFFENLRIIEDAQRNAKSRKLSQLPALVAVAIVQKKETSAACRSAGLN